MIDFFVSYKAIMKKVDMHMHTMASDGTWDATELKNELIKNKIGIFSVTDHDSVDNIKNMQEILRNRDNLIFIPGTELTAEYEGKEYHLNLYNYDINDLRLLELLNWTNQNKLSSNFDYINYAANKYDNVSAEDYERYEYDRKRGGWKSANYMIDKGIHKDIPEHLKDVYNSGLKAMLKSPEEVIHTAKKSGGKIFLAHPSYHYRDTAMPPEELEYWLALGIDGIECFSPYNGNKAQYYVDFCKRNNLMISGGSDCHGDFIPSRVLGVPDLSLDDLNIKKLLD
ncbi:MAG: PHP domain-containing protein [Sedimentibacter sp.]|nr:PHP domain-containing protein [Sedimentibacter sp.]